jgi:hypothetical protein
LTPALPVKKKRKPKRAPIVAVVENRVEALRLRKLGYGYQRIGIEMNVDVRTAWELVQNALRDLIEEPAREVLKLELERLDMMLEKALDKACTLGHEQAIAAVLQIMARRAKYLGLDAPEKVSATVAPATTSILDLPSRMPPEAVRSVVATLLLHETDEARRSELEKVQRAVEGL